MTDTDSRLKQTFMNILKLNYKIILYRTFLCFIHIIEKVLKEIEIKKIEGILKDGIQEEIGQYITSQDLHVFVEKKLGWRVQFSIIEDCFYNIFPTDRLKSEENR